MDNAKGGPSQPLVERPRRKVSRRVRDEVTGLGWLRCRQTKMGDEDDEGQVDIGRLRMGGDGFSWVQETPKYGRSPFIGGTLYASGPRI